MGRKGANYEQIRDWRKNRKIGRRRVPVGTSIQELRNKRIDGIGMALVNETRLRDIDGVDDVSWVKRLVTTDVYAKVYGKMNSVRCTRHRIYARAIRGQLKEFVICGKMFILLNTEEMECYMSMWSEINKDGIMYSEMRELMRQPNSLDDSNMIERNRDDAYNEWINKFSISAGLGFEGRYIGDEWDNFFNNIFPTYVNRMKNDTILMYLEKEMIYPIYSLEKGSVEKVTETLRVFYNRYCKWCDDNFYIPVYINQFSIYLEKKGFSRQTGRKSMITYFNIDDVLKKEIEEREELERVRLLQNHLYIEKKRVKKESHVDCFDFFNSEDISSGDIDVLGLDLYESFATWCIMNGIKEIGRNTFYNLCFENDIIGRKTRNGMMFKINKEI